MNGEVSQICRITAAARAALRDGTELNFTPLKYEGSTTFNFCDRQKTGAPLFRAKDPADWFSHLKKEGISNIFMVMGLKVDRRVLGFANNASTTLFVRYADNTVTRFVPHWTFNNETNLWSIQYTEYLAEGAPETDPEYRNESSLMGATLKDIAELADQLEAPSFAKTFRKAANILNGDVVPRLKEGAVKPLIPEDRMKYYLAADVADVFGAMGSWNDTPAAAAHEKGLDRDYITLSERLIYSIRLMTMYAVNFPI